MMGLEVFNPTPFLWATGLGLIALFPGVHFAMVLLVAGPLLLGQFGLASGLLALAWAVVIARSMHTLAVVYHPVAADQLASADPAQRLCAAGQGKFATRLMGEALWMGTVAVTVTLMLAITLGSWLQLDLIKAFIKGLSWLIWPFALVWLGLMLYQARNKFATLLVFVVSGYLGIVALQHPSVQGSHHAMTPLLTGLFGVPVLLLALLEKHPAQRFGEQTQRERVAEREPDATLRYFGLFAGLMSVVLPGLGTSSLISMGQDLAEDDAQYLSMASAAESMGEMLALTLGILGLAMRSSDAAVIQKLVETSHGEFVLGPVFPYVLLGTLVVAAWVGLRLVSLVGIPYRVMLAIVPIKVQSLVVLGAMLWVVWSHTEGWGLAIVAVGTLIHLGARRLGTPNQAFFSCMVVPMVCSMLGLSLF